MASEFARWAETYDEAVGELSRATWASGILQEIVRSGVRTGSVLDIGCGTGIGGRILKAVAPFYLVGLDQCTAMSKRAANVYDSLIEADFSSFVAWGEPFDFIVSGFDSLNYLSSDRLATFFTSARRCLKPEGQLIFDYSSPRLLREEWKSRTHTQSLVSGTLEWTMCHETSTGGCEIQLVFLGKDGKVEWQERHLQFTHDTFEIHELANSAGFEVLRVRNLTDESFSPGENTHVYTLIPRA